MQSSESLFHRPEVPLTGQGVLKFLVANMLTTENIIDINNVLELCDQPKLTDSEIEFLNAVNTEVTTKCDIYVITQRVIIERGKIVDVKKSISRCQLLAQTNECDLHIKETKKDTPTIPIFGGRLK